MRSRFSKTIALGGNEFRTRWSPVPVHYRDDDGVWRDIQTDLVDVGEGRVGNAGRAPFGLSVALERSGELVEISSGEGHVLAWALEGARGGASHVDVPQPNRIVHRQILNKVDLVVTSMSTGVKEELVLHSPSAPSMFRFPLHLEGLDAAVAADGGLKFADVDSGEVVFSTPPGRMWDDASGEEPPSPAEVSDAVSFEVVQQPDGPVLEVSVDQGWLEDPARVFPVTVDPTVNHYGHEPFFYLDTSFDADDTSQAYSSLSHLYTGRDGADEFRAFLQFGGENDQAALTPGDGAHDILDADFGAYNVDRANCARRMYVKRVTETWQDDPDGHAAYFGPSYDATSGTDTGTYDGCSDGWVTWDVDGMVDNWENGTATNYGIALLGSLNYTDSYRVFLSQNSSNSAYHPYLEVDYRNTVAPTPTDPTPGDGAVRTDVSQLSAELSADADGDWLRSRFQLRNTSTGEYLVGTAGSSISDGALGRINGGTTAPYGTATYDLTGLAVHPLEGTYAWRVAAEDDGGDLSDWTDWQSFTVDGTPPSAPDLDSSTHPTQGDWTATDSASFSWSEPADATGIDGYWTSVTADPDSMPGGWQGNTRSRDLSGVGEGRWWFNVAARDGAGNRGEAASYLFGVDLTDPTIDDLTSSHPNAAGAGPTEAWSNDPDVTFARRSLRCPLGAGRLQPQLRSVRGHRPGHVGGLHRRDLDLPRP